MRHFRRRLASSQRKQTVSFANHLRFHNGSVETNTPPYPSLRGYPYEFDFSADHANKRCELELKCNREYVLTQPYSKMRWPTRDSLQRKETLQIKKKPWKKIGWHLLQIFILVPSPRILTQNIYKNSEIFEENAKLHKVISYFYQMYAQI